MGANGDSLKKVISSEEEREIGLGEGGWFGLQEVLGKQ